MAMQPRTQIEPPELNVIEGGVTANYSGQPLSLPKAKLEQMWVLGLINESSYVALALMLDQVGADGFQELDVDRFIADWTVEVDPEKDKFKTPKAKTILGVIESLEKAELSTVERQTVQLTIGWDLL